MAIDGKEALEVRRPAGTPDAAAAASGPAETPRLEWLDVLRGWAALVVALHHASFYFIPGIRSQMIWWVDPGRYGVLLFFLVSGYIVPASLERRGSVRAFWIRRLFRIMPLLAAACAIAVLPFLLGVRGLREDLAGYDPATALLAHVTMLQDVLGVPSVINVLWTLSYEMVFYLLVVALFVIGRHRRSAPIAAALAIAALLLGGLLPTVLVSQALGTSTTVTVTAALLVAAIAGAMSGRRALQVAGGVLGGLVAGILVLINGRVGPWEGLVILAVMFMGTALYRAEHRQIGRLAAATAAGAVLAGGIAAGLRYAPEAVPTWQIQEFRVYWTGSLVMAAATFALAWALRRRRFPRWMTGLGTISFSIYLLHHVLLMLANQLFGIPDHDRLLGLGAFLLVLLVVSWAAYRWIEAPAQRLGRRLTAPPRRPRKPLPAADPLPAPARARA